MMQQHKKMRINGWQSVKQSMRMIHNICLSTSTKNGEVENGHHIYSVMMIEPEK